MSREYSPLEISALRTVTRDEWRGADDPAEGGPAQYATGPFWPDELERLARDFERRAPAYRIAAAALRREIQQEGRL